MLGFHGFKMTPHLSRQSERRKQSWWRKNWTCRSTKRKHSFFTTRVSFLFWFLRLKREKWLERTTMSVSLVFHLIYKSNEASMAMQKQRLEFLQRQISRKHVINLFLRSNLEFSLSWNKEYPCRPSTLTTQSTTDWNRYSQTNWLTLLQVNCQVLTMVQTERTHMVQSLV